MKTSRKNQKYTNVEYRAISRFLLVVLIILGAGCIICAVTLPELTWVLVICFLYLLALEAILLTSN